MVHFAPITFWKQLIWKITYMYAKKCKQTNKNTLLGKWYKPLELVAADSLSEIVTELWRIVYV